MHTLSTADRILHHARRILDRRGAAAVTMRAVAKAVGITPMALYRHFPDRDGLLNAIADQGFAEFAAVLKSSAILSEASRSEAKSMLPEAAPSKSSVILSAAKRSGAKPKDLHFNSLEDTLATLLDLNLDFALANPHLFELMFLRPRPGARQFPADFKSGASPTAGIASAIIQRGIDAGLLRREDPWEITFESGALLQGLVMLWIGRRFGGTAEEFRALCHRSFRRYLHGIRK
ncbi:MAG TPA: TetR/AcrR family transcriptional regulator [Acidobacteriaceae bacterium]|nr:TetR/AcrR family transcriptional regulator [Acidobacteriaceae bacterium]